MCRSTPKALYWVNTYSIIHYDITKQVDNHIRLFADDTSLSAIVDDRYNTADDLNDDLLNIHKWANDWCVNINATKTESVFFTRKKNFPNPRLYMSNMPI